MCVSYFLAKRERGRRAVEFGAAQPFGSEAKVGQTKLPELEDLLIIKSTLPHAAGKLKIASLEVRHCKNN